MHFTVKSDALRSALSLVIKASDQRHGNPILSHALISADGNTISVAATNMDAFISVDRAADVADPGKAVMPIKALLDFVRNAPKGAIVEVETTDDSATVTCRAASAGLPTLSVVDFPTLKPPVPTASLTVPAAEFAKVLSLVKHAMCSEETRYYLCGIKIEWRPDDQVLRAIATDGHRLALAEMPLSASAAAWSGIVPREAVPLILDVSAKKPAGNVRLDLSDLRVAVTYGDASIVTKLVDGTFLEYEKVIPRGNANVMTTTAYYCRSVVTAVSSINADLRNSVKFDLADEVTITSFDAGAATSTFRLNGITTYSGEPMEIGFQARYLRDLLKELGGSVVTFAFGRSCAPAVVTCEAVPGFKSVIMPMRV